MKFPLRSKEIQDLISHKYPFLLIDIVLEIDYEKNSLISVKNLSISEQIFDGHFIDMPVYPGVYILEGIAQSAGVLASLLGMRGEGKFLLTSIKNAKFRHMAIPGDKIVFEVCFLKKKRSFYWFKGIASIDNKEIAESEISACISGI